MKKRILIVDDAWLIRGGLKNLLVQNGFEVLEAENGKEALDIALSEPIDAVILDLLMPVMTGLELIEQLHQQNFQKPLIVLTADIQDSVKKQCEDLGVMVFLNKPPQKEKILTALTACGV